MPCTGPDYSCNSLISIRSPLGAVRPGTSNAASQGPRPGPITRGWLALREMIAHRRQRRALAALDRRLLDDIGVSGDAAMREVSKPIWK